MSNKEALLRQLESDFGDVSGSLLYRAIKLSSSITNDGRVAIYITGSGYLRMLDGPVLTIELRDSRVIVRLPKYCKQPVYTCTIDNNYLTDNSIKLINVFRIIYRDAIARIDRCGCVSHLESLLLAGILRSSTCDMIKVYHKDGVYFDNAHRCSAFFNVLIGEILLTNHQYNVMDILDCFSGVITDDDIDDKLKPGILYLNNQNVASVKQLKKYTSLKFVDVSDAVRLANHDDCLDCQSLIDMGFQSIRMNGNQIVGIDPIYDFLTLP